MPEVDARHAQRFPERRYTELWEIVHRVLWNSLKDLDA